MIDPKSSPHFQVCVEILMVKDGQKF